MIRHFFHHIFIFILELKKFFDNERGSSVRRQTCQLTIFDSINDSDLLFLYISIYSIKIFENFNKKYTNFQDLHVIMQLLGPASRDYVSTFLARARRNSMPRDGFETGKDPRKWRNIARREPRLRLINATAFSRRVSHRCWRSQVEEFTVSRSTRSIHN